MSAPTFPDIPSHWYIGPLRHLAGFTTGWTPPTGEADSYEGENLWANISDLGPHYLADTAKRVSDEAAAKARMTAAEPGDLLFSFKLSVGAVSIATVRMFTNEAIATFRSTSRLTAEYAYYALPEYVVKNANENIYGAKLLNTSLIRSARIAVPPLEEQRTIAAFLDRETAQIDAMVDAQERLVALLEERREAAVTATVTAGNLGSEGTPAVPEWYTSVPAGWSLARVSNLVSVLTDGAHISPDTSGGVFDFVSTRDVRQGRIDFDGALKTSTETYKYMVRTGCQPLPGDVLFSKDGTVGRTAVVREKRDFVVASSLIIVRPRLEAVTSRFLAYAFQSRNFQEQALSFVRGAGLPRISVANFGKATILVPPLYEQFEIVRHLDAVTARTDAMIAKAQESIALMKERRAALISAAVTGRIDVRTGSEQVERDLEEARI